MSNITSCERRVRTLRAVYTVSDNYVMCTPCQIIMRCVHRVRTLRPVYTDHYVMCQIIQMTRAGISVSLFVQPE